MPKTLDFDLGWFDGNCKKWLVVPEDLSVMYSKCNGNDISLWCDVSMKKEKSAKKRKSNEHDGDDIETIYKELLERYPGDTYTKPQLKLWARMIRCGTHEGYEKPPEVPLITGSAPKRKKTNSSLHDVITDAARAVSQTFSSTASPKHSSSSLQMGISPGKAVDLCGKNLEQLRYAQQLYEDNVLSTAEYTEQKNSIMDSLRKLNGKTPE